MKRFLPHIVFTAFAVLFIFFSLTTYKDYGITADEELNYQNGRALLSYYKTPTNIALIQKQLQDFKHTPLLDLHNRLYPAFISLFNPKAYYEWYHLINLIFSLCIFAAFYYLIYWEYKKIPYAVLGFIAVFLTPRFLGDIPVNPKDVPFAIFYFLTLVFIYKTSGIRNPFRLLVLGLLFGLTQSLRTVGFTMYAVYFIYELYLHKSVKEIFLDIVMIFTVAGFFTASLWPFIGANYFRNTMELFSNASDFAPWNNFMLFQGKFITKYERPWSYLPVWFLITTPIYILVCSVASISLVKKSKLVFLLLTTLILNFLLYFVLNPVIYNGLRHFLYLLPLLVLMALIFIIEFIDKKERKKYPKAFMLGFMFTNMIIVAVTMFRLHPYEYVYFNELVGGLNGAQGNYEMDYWGASYSEASAWLKGEKFSKVYSCNLSYAMQYKSQGKYQMVGSSAESDFIVCDYENDKRLNYKGDIMYEIKRFNVPLNIIRKNTKL
jgi:hypothetical protein